MVQKAERNTVRGQTERMNFNPERVGEKKGVNHMFLCIGFGFGLWWIFPVIMIVMFVFCFFMMRSMMAHCMAPSAEKPRETTSDGKENG